MRRRESRRSLIAALAGAVCMMSSGSPAAPQLCLRGVNAAGAEFGDLPGRYGFDYAYPTPATIDALARLGLTTIRLPFRWERLQPRLNEPLDRDELARLDTTVAAARGAGLTTILDLHNYAYFNKARIGSPDVPVRAFADVWSRLAQHFRRERSVVFGLMNEPYDIAAADWLVAQGYTSHAKLVLDGRSNGGLLLGAVLNQRPDLAAAAVPAVGVMDMLRYHKFTVGAGWASDYGNSDTPEGFKYLAAYSPLHTVKAGANYPAVLVTTGDHDDRVFPAHSYKYTAAMQAAADPASGPVLIHIESNAGHGGSSGTSPVSKTIADWSLRMGFGAHFTGWGGN